MEQRSLGRSGLRVSLVGLGCNNFGGRIDLEQSRKVIDAAIDLGITLLDTADTYGEKGGSETIMGEVLGAKRKRIVLATKFSMAMDDTGWLQGGSRRYIMSAVEASLRRLRTDWIDLYQYHKWDPLTPIEETMRALDDLVTQGKVRYIGCSNLPAWKVVESCWAAERNGLNRFVSCQDHYNMLERGIEPELMPAAEAHGMGLLPFFPLASGFLTGKYKRDAMPEGARLTKSPDMAKRFISDARWPIVERLERFASERGHTMLELAFSWLAAHPVVSSVIAGATRPEQLGQNVKAVGWKLTADDMAAIDGLLNA